MKKNGIKTLTCIFLLWAGAITLVSAQIEVTFETPPLLDEMSGLESLLNANIGFAVDEIGTMAEEMLEKPLLTSSCGKAAASAGAVSTLGTPWLSEGITVKTGASAGAYTDTYDFNLITERFESLEPEDDFTLGAGVRAVECSLIFPLDFLIRRLSLSLSGSYMDLTADEYFANGTSGSAALGWTPVRPLKAGFFSWIPFTLKAGAGWTTNNIGTSIAAGEISESFELDLDGSGPFPGYDIEVVVDPIIDVAIAVETWNFSGSLSTGFRLADFFSIFAGGGMNYTMGSTGISVDSTPGYLILGFFEQYVDEDVLAERYGEEKAETQHGEINITGGVSGDSPDGFTTFLYGGVRLDFGPVFLDVPLLYTPPDTLAAAVTLGVEL